MNWNAMLFDWNQVRGFLATAEEGSLSAAARALGQTQPTLSRQVGELEKSLGVTLFERGPRTMALTETGRELLVHVRAMGEAATRLSTSAAGQSQAAEGLVRITATDMTASYALPPILAELRDLAPKIRVEVVVSNEVHDLIRREADIAIRHVRPEQNELIGRKIGETVAMLYASRSYLATAGRPTCKEDLQDMSFVGLSPVEKFLPSVSAAGLDLTAEQFRFSAANGVALIELVRQDLGISIVPRHVADRFPELVPVLPDHVAFPVPVWLVTHRELRTSRRIRIVFDLLDRSLGQYC